MIGIVLLAASWVLLRLERKPLSVLGFNRPARRSLEFGIGLSIAAAFAAIQFLVHARLGAFSWTLNPDYALHEGLNALRWTVNSVLYEELLFRGYLLYKAIELLGPRRGVALSAVAFGVYHWFSYGILGQVVPMVFVFILTGSFGLMLGLAFATTRSVVLPVALHLGWNLTTLVVFSSGPIGPQLLVPSGEAAAMSAGAQVLVKLVIPLFLPVLVIWGLVRMKGGSPGAPAGGSPEADSATPWEREESQP